MNCKVLIIIPCYNEEESIEHVISNIRNLCPDYDYLVVNDCSTDSCKEILDKGNYNYINLPVNLGIGGGVQSGYMYAVEHGYDIAVQIDGDGQHDPLYLKKVIQRVANNEMDMCIGSRFIAKEGFQTSFARRMGIKFLSWLIKLLTGYKVLDVTSGFRACNKKLTAFYSENYAQDYPEPEAIISAIVNGFTVGEEPVVMKERQAGESSIGALSGIYYMIKVTISLIAFRLIIGKKKKNKKEDIQNV